jgi:hypothetical protein
MDEYAKEIRDLQQEIDRLVEAEGDKKEIADLEMQVEVLSAIYRQAEALYRRGEADRELRRGLRLRGYGDWTLDNVYAFVYEQAVELPDEGPKAFADDIRQTDFAGRLETV